MKSIKVAIGRGIYNLPITEDADASTIQAICSSINLRVNGLISQNNLKNEPNDLLILLATIEMLQHANKANVNDASSSGNQQRINNNNEDLESTINAEVERAVLTHLNSLHNSIKKMIDS